MLHPIDENYHLKRRKRLDLSVAQMGIIELWKCGCFNVQSICIKLFGANINTIECFISRIDIHKANPILYYVRCNISCELVMWRDAAIAANCFNTGTRSYLRRLFALNRVDLFIRPSAFQKARPFLLVCTRMWKVLLTMSFYVLFASELFCIQSGNISVISDFILYKS